MSPLRSLSLLLGMGLVLGTPFVDVSADEIHLPWMKNVQDAQSKAKKEGKDLFINFTGSDWCHWCKRLEGEVFSQPSFIEKVSDKYVFLFLDFPRSPDKKAEVLDEKRNEELRAKYRVMGFPAIVITTSDGTIYGKSGYQEGGPEKYLEHLRQIDADGTKVKALLAASESEDEDQLRTLLQGALPVMAKNSLFDFPEYEGSLKKVRGVDPKGEHGLLRYVLGHEENQALGNLLRSFGREQPDWHKVHELLANSPNAYGMEFVNPAYGCARHLQEEKRWAEARALYERLLGDAVLEGNKKAHDLITKAIEECDKGDKGKDG